ncbi:MAG: acyl-CoA dehydrogenase family protein, partial [Candidatus Rokuibacteriota bacterium]
MDLALTESQEMLRASARTFVEREAPTHTLVALQKQESSLVPDLWRKAVDAGWPGILIPTEYGGSESTLTDAAVLFEELGRGPVPGPFFSSGVLGALTMLEAGSEAQRKAIFPAVARGEAVLAVAITDPSTSWGPQSVTLPPQRLGDRYRLDGIKLFVSDAT